MTPVRALSWLASLSLLLASSLGPNQHVAIAAPPPITISLSYADDLRANPTNFPTPWASCTAVTDANGIASCSVTPNEVAGHIPPPGGVVRRGADRPPPHRGARPVTPGRSAPP